MLSGAVEHLCQVSRLLLVTAFTFLESVSDDSSYAPYLVYRSHFAVEYLRVASGILPTELKILLQLGGPATLTLRIKRRTQLFTRIASGCDRFSTV